MAPVPHPRAFDRESGESRVAVARLGLDLEMHGIPAGAKGDGQGFQFVSGT